MPNSVNVPAPVQRAAAPSRRWTRACIRVGKKILEEAGEVWLAAEHESDEALAEEISQLLYWAQVLMIARGLTLDDVYRKL